MKAIYVLCWCLIVPTAAAAAPADGRTNVLATIGQFTAALSSRDIDSVLATFVASDEVVLLLPTPLVPMRIDGQANARTALGVFFDSLAAATAFRVTAHNTTVALHGDVAVVFGYLLLYSQAGAMPQRVVSRATFVLVRGPDGWRIQHLHAGAMPELSDFLSQSAPTP